MEKKTKIIIAVGITAMIFAVGTMTATVILCKRIYDKPYFTIKL